MIMRQVCLSSLVLAAALAATPAFAAGSGTLNVGYTIAFWAIPFGHTAYEAKFVDGAYDAKSHFETSGIVSLFWNSKIDANANGKIGGHSVTPVLYDSYSTDHNSKVQRVKVAFDKDVPETTAEPAYNTTKYPVTDEQKKGSVDPMTAITTILSGVKADAKNPCGTGAQVFDGRRRYDVSFTYVKDEPLKLDSGLYNGTAHQCLVHYNEIAGYKQKIISEGKKLPAMHADFIDVSGGPSGHYVIAAKLWASTGWGTVTAELSDLKVNGAPVKS
jgi:hypothetical protein